ncbi:MAG: ferritin family protein [bacterium]|mgnify:CR=1 FL=1|nr:ferritin family protein [bacterium]
MENTYSSREILNIAVKIEENGYDFYEDLSKTAKDEKLKILFHELADMETSHRKTFIAMLNNVPDDDFETLSSYGFSDETFQYLNAIADSKIFKKGEKYGLDTNEDILTAFAIAIGLEKDSIIFYYEVMAYISEKHKTTLQNILSEEKQHLITLSKKRQEYL